MDVDEKRVVLEPRPAPGPVATTNGVGTLAKRIGDDLNALVRDHVDLARTELTDSLKSAAADTVGVLVSALVALIGFAMLCVTAVVALAPLIPQLWLRLLIMSIVYLLVGGAVAGLFVKKLRGDVPELSRTRSEARRTARALKEQVQHG